MRRGMAVVLALAVLATAPAASGATCTASLTFRATRYARVATQGHVNAGRRLGAGSLAACPATTMPPGYGVAARGPDAARRMSVYAVAGVRPQVAVALRTAMRTSLYVSRATATAAERAVLAKLRHG